MLSVTIIVRWDNHMAPPNTPPNGFRLFIEGGLALAFSKRGKIFENGEPGKIFSLKPFVIKQFLL